MARYERFDDDERIPNLTIFERNQQEKTDLFTTPSSHQANLVEQALITLNIISIVVSTVCGVITFFLAIEDKSVSALGFAVDTILDVLAFAIIIWRFVDGQEQTKREALVLRILATLFIVSGLAVFIDSAIDLQRRQHPVHNQYLVIAVGIQALIFLCLSIGKYLVARRLHAISAYSDAFNTFISALMALSVTVSISIYNANDNIWYLDSVMGMFFSLTIVLYGFWMIFKSRQ
jgi:divalent metal cation (Fe/Co/Zn/Cd) transporter